VKAQAAAIEGVLPVLQTPFDLDGAIDEATLKREVDWVLSRGVDGVTIAMVSEVLRLDLNERQEVAARICEAVNGRGSVVVSVGAESTVVATRLAKHAQSVGATAVMAIPPLSVRAEGEELVGYYDAIVEEIEIPVVVQDASSYVGGGIPVSAMANMQARYGEKVYFKPEAQPLGPRLSALLEASGGEARVFDGSGGVALIDTFRRGIVGSMPAADVCWAVVTMWRALKRGDFDTAYRVSMPLAAMLAVQTSLGAYVAVEKYLLCRQGIFVNDICRGPVDFHVDEPTALQLDALLGILEESCGRATAQPWR
jgi:dihydrodipicolinate synthase/N-acetylneuraminate lyase